MRRSLAPLLLVTAFARLAHADAPAQPLPPLPPPSPGAEAPAPPSQPPPPLVLPPPVVTVDSTRPFTVLERRANRTSGWSLTLPFPSYNSGEQWEPICVAPCELHLDPNGVYRVGGGEVGPSSPFVLPRGRTDPLRLHIRAGSSFLHDGGIVLTVLGAAAIVGGVLSVGLSTAESDPAAALRGGVAFFVPGLASVLIGTTLWLMNGSSVVTDDGRTL